MDINKIDLLLKTIDCGSMKKASEMLNYTQSGLIYMINNLESELCIPLLTRTHKGVKPTKECEELLPYFQQLVDLSNSLDKKISSLALDRQEQLYIGTTPAISRHMLPPVIYNMMHLNRNLDIKVMEDMHDVSEWVQNETVDLAVVEKGFSFDHKWIPLVKYRICAAVPLDFKHSGDTIKFSELKDLPIIIPEYNQYSERTDALRKLAEENGFTQNLSFSSLSATSLLHMVGNDLGATFLTSIYMPECPHDVKMYPLDPPIWRDTGIIIKKTRSLSAPMKQFISMMQEYVSSIDWCEQNAASPIISADK
mgnify:CR=1 FL=1